MKNIEMGKKYRCRDGAPATVLTNAATQDTAAIEQRVAEDWVAAFDKAWSEKLK